MQKIITIALLLFLTMPFCFGQEMTSREVEKIANNFIEKLKKKNKFAKNIMVTDFTDGKVKPTELGRFLAEEFSYYFSDLDHDNFSIIDRSGLEKLLGEQDLIRDELIDPITIAKLGKLKGMKHLLYGTIIDSGESYTVYIKLVKVETLEILASTRGRISKVPSLPKHID